MTQDEMDDCIETAWGIIANASGGNWNRESPEWQEAAAGWRDKYIGAMSTRRATSTHVPAERDS
jgi:hypothetical protein